MDGDLEDSRIPDVEEGEIKLCCQLKRRNAMLEPGATSTLTTCNAYN